MQRKTQPRHRRAPVAGRGVLVTTAGVFGELLLTAGALVLLFAVYMLWGTGLQTAAAQNDLRDQFEQHAVERDEAEEPAVPDIGDAYGILRVPRFGEDWERIVVEGTEPDDLRDGPGHYPASVDPGQLGNFSIAGHRSGHGEPFARFPELRAGDIVEIETLAGVYRYELDDAPDGDDDGNVIENDAMWVVDPVPGEPDDTEPTEARLTLTTCWPRRGSEKRMFATGVLVSEDQRPAA